MRGSGPRRPGSDQGSPQATKKLNISPQIGISSVIYSNENLKDIYVLDSSNARIVVANKELEFKAFYIADEFKDSLGIFASEKDKKMIVLGSGGKLYSVEIKHLE